jgi:hypothetical protein
VVAAVERLAPTQFTVAPVRGVAGAEPPQWWGCPDASGPRSEVVA